MTGPEWLLAIVVCLMVLAVLYEVAAFVVKGELERRRPRPSYPAIAGPPGSVTGSVHLELPEAVAAAADVAAPAAEVKLRPTPRSRRSPLAERL